MDRLNPAEFREPDADVDPARQREFELELLERVITRAASDRED